MCNENSCICLLTPHSTQRLLTALSPSMSLEVFCFPYAHTHTQTRRHDVQPRLTPHMQPHPTFHGIPNQLFDQVSRSHHQILLRDEAQRGGQVHAAAPRVALQAEVALLPPLAAPGVLQPSARKSAVERYLSISLFTGQSSVQRALWNANERTTAPASATSLVSPCLPMG